MKSNEVNMNPEVTTNNTIKAVLDHNNIPIEELLGSVTTYNNVEGSQQLRTSARVFKKMKLDSAVAVTNPLPTDSSNKKETVKEELTKQEVVKRPFRPSWSQEDKNLFFEALNEYGKDFEAIHSHITNKLRKKGLPDSVMKTKDQVRHFYYRNWHKISKHLKFTEDVKKLAQELYGLINYGELRKKIGSVSEKNLMKLNELIYRGVVAIRTKGKTVRIKTPMCRALRKLNQLDEKHDDLKLPTRVNVELVPKDMNTWLRVQGMSQNPRVKAFLPLQKRLNVLIKSLSFKWKTTEACAYEHTLLSSDAITSDCVPEKKVVEDNKSILEPLLRLQPPQKVNIEAPTINLSEYLTSHSICLNAFEERIGVKIPGEQLWVTKGTTRKGGTKRARNESNSEKTPPNNPKQSSSVTINNKDNNENCINESDMPLNVNEVVDEAVNTILALQSQIINNVDEVKSNTEEVKIETSESENKDLEKKEHYINLMKNGWTFGNCGTLTIGELYLMFGSNSNLMLEYSWDQPEKLTSKTETEACDSLNKDNQETCVDDAKAAENVVDSSSTMAVADDLSKKPTEESSNLKTTLKQLLSIAKLHYQKDIIQHPSGYACGSNKNNTTARSKQAPKTNNKVGEKNCSDNGDKSATSDINNTEPKITVSTSVVPIIIQPPVSVFRRPMSPNADSLRAQLDSIQRLQPRYCNRKGRPRTKQVVVERKLPLLPNKIDNGRQIVQMNIVSQDEIRSVPRTIAPKIVNIDKTEHNIVPANSIAMQTTIGVNTVSEIPSSFTSIVTTNSIDNNVNCIMSSTSTIDITDNAVTPSRVGSPTSISNLLDLALDPQDQTIVNKDDTGIPSFVGLLPTVMSSSTPLASPSRILKENENNWLNSEVGDFSLSSLLGHLESPMKAIQASTSTASEDNHLSQDVDAQLQSLLTESSIDYMAKFADLAAQVVSDVKK